MAYLRLGCLPPVSIGGKQCLSFGQLSSSRSESEYGPLCNFTARPPGRSHNNRREHMQNVATTLLIFIDIMNQIRNYLARMHAIYPFDVHMTMTTAHEQCTVVLRDICVEAGIVTKLHQQGLRHTRTHVPQHGPTNRHMGDLWLPGLSTHTWNGLVLDFTMTHPYNSSGLTRRRPFFPSLQVRMVFFMLTLSNCGFSGT